MHVMPVAPIELDEFLINKAALFMLFSCGMFERFASFSSHRCVIVTCFVFLPVLFLLKVILVR